MSVRIMTLCYEARFGSPSRKAVAVALADHADDQGQHVYPSVAALAYKTELNGRTVQRALRDLEEIGLIVVMSDGGSGPKDTREWRFNLSTLEALVKGDTLPSSKGDTVSPIEPLRVTLSPKKGDTVPPEPSGTKKKKGARAPAHMEGQRSRALRRGAERQFGARPNGPRKGPQPLAAVLPPIPPPQPTARSPAVACAMADLAKSLRSRKASP